MSWWLAWLSALWLGLLTSISPCPLATNIAAISFLGRQVGKPRHLLTAGLLYVAGRTVAYVALAALLLAGLLASDGIARFLQQYLNLLLGPLLIVVGLVLLELLGGSLALSLGGSRLQERAARGGWWWALALGVIFALSFCPVSAGLYFGALLPLAAAQESRLAIPAIYGVGTALPVVGFALLLGLGGQYVGRAFNRLTQVERWGRLGTGVVFLGAGLYLSLTHVYDLPSFAR
jgi:cytochrome c biogenesis protein CcdA